MTSESRTACLLHRCVPVTLPRRRPIPVHPRHAARRRAAFVAAGPIHAIDAPRHAGWVSP